MADNRELAPLEREVELCRQYLEPRAAAARRAPASRLAYRQACRATRWSRRWCCSRCSRTRSITASSLACEPGDDQHQHLPRPQPRCTRCCAIPIASRAAITPATRWRSPISASGCSCTSTPRRASRRRVGDNIYQVHITLPYVKERRLSRHPQAAARGDRRRRGAGAQPHARSARGLRRQLSARDRGRGGERARSPRRCSRKSLPTWCCSTSACRRWTASRSPSTCRSSTEPPSVIFTTAYDAYAIEGVRSARDRLSAEADPAAAAARRASRARAITPLRLDVLQRDRARTRAAISRCRSAARST